MLSLKNSNEFQRLFKSGKWYGCSFLNIYVEKNNKDFNMVGIAVGKKFAKSSVKRNRMKRLIRESYRTSEFKFLKGYNIVIVCKNDVDVLDISFKKVEKALVECFEKAGLCVHQQD